MIFVAAQVFSACLTFSRMFSTHRFRNTSRRFCFLPLETTEPLAEALGIWFRDRCEQHRSRRHPTDLQLFSDLFRGSGPYYSVVYS